MTSSGIQTGFERRTSAGLVEGRLAEPLPAMTVAAVVDWLLALDGDSDVLLCCTPATKPPSSLVWVCSLASTSCGMRLCLVIISKEFLRIATGVLR